ncbi:MAG: CRISPR-associated endonuclease Cas3'', partial [Methanosarcinales archaeon]|nr:CRISPR-associated endonuclease Cas3'' [Methanosarcinales archaeon]
MNEKWAYYQYWGKANKFDSQGALSYHLLVYHCLDVAAAGHLLLRKDKHLLSRFTEITYLDDETATNLITFYLAIHDIGKFSDRFQNLQPDLFEHLRGMTCNKKPKLRHDTMGYHLWDSVWSSLWDENLLHLEKNDVISKRHWHHIIDSWVQAVTGHHGKPPLLDDNNHVQNLFTDENIIMAKSFVKEVAQLFILDKSNQFFVSYDEELEDSFKRSSWLLAGLAILSDWIGSNSEYCSEPMPLGDYWNKIALPNAKEAIKKAGVLPSAIYSKTGMRELFPKIDKPSPLQSHVSTCELADNAQLFILEEVTGSGKTEAALTLAHRLMNQGLADGIFVALPTMATANAMYGRLVEAYRMMFESDTAPSLILAHSARHLSGISDTFRHSSGLEKSQIDRCYDKNEETASAQCNEWLADNRKKALLADVGVGTIDQALMAVLPSKHQSLRLLGLSRNVLIVDEVHAYDPYMHTLLCALLRFHAALG